MGSKMIEIGNEIPTVGITFGRWNPPHIGHKNLWELMSTTSNHWYIGTNKETLDKNNPLPFDVKLSVMELISPSVKGRILLEKTWLTMASEIYDRYGYICLNVYSNEEYPFDLLNRYNNVEGLPHGYYNFKKITKYNTIRLCSSTNIRKAILNNDFNFYKKHSGLTDYHTQCKLSFDIIKEHLSPYHQ